MQNINFKNILRGQTLFYTEAVNYLRKIFNTEDYDYIDNCKGFTGDLIISSRNRKKLMMIEIKSENETEPVSTKKRGSTFFKLRKIIASLDKITSQNQGWLAYIAQVWDYMDKFPVYKKQVDITKNNLKVFEDLLVIPANKRCELDGALRMFNLEYKIKIPQYTFLENQTKNIVVLIFKHNELDVFFNAVISKYSRNIYLTCTKSNEKASFDWSSIHLEKIKVTTNYCKFFKKIKNENHVKYFFSNAFMQSFISSYNENFQNDADEEKFIILDISLNLSEEVTEKLNEKNKYLIEKFQKVNLCFLGENSNGEKLREHNIGCKWEELKND